jgi:hypothetical protein
MGTEYIDIRTCPKCGRPHRYKLSVERSYVMKLMTMGDASEPPRRVSFTRLFTCPSKNEEFQGQLTLTETSSDRVRSVDVLGISDENGQH